MNPILLQDAADRLSAATSPEQIRAAHDVLKRAIGRVRKAVAKTFGPLAQTYIVAIQAWDRQRLDGVPPAERAAYLERSLRSAWPAGREWKYLCQTCADYGLEMHDCPGDATCGRYTRHLPHEYGTPCWCDRGLRFRAKPKKDDDFTAAGKTGKRK